MTSSQERTTARRCEVCGKSTREPTYGFSAILARNGFSGDKAHRSCVANLKTVATHYHPPGFTKTTCGREAGGIDTTELRKRVTCKRCILGIAADMRRGGLKP